MVSNKVKILAGLCGELFILIRFVSSREFGIPAAAYCELGDLGHNWPRLLLTPDVIDFDWVVADLKACSDRDFGEAWANIVRPSLQKYAEAIEHEPT